MTNTFFRAALGCVALVAVGGTAQAADMYRKAPVAAPIEAVSPVSIYNWSGFYAGANLGGEFLRDTGTGAVETFSETHPMRHFSLPELEWLASATGFERLCAEEFLTGASPGPDTWGLCLVWRKC